ncbi:MAG: Cytochrome c6 [Chroococcopsis gigantea SAG 12.99]|nr:c-type cytochrome [Chlorogloea purpurea SAG 13.99]MDV3001224.1 Cytochrome c6 [Chroococcopsis gigantea SAG 12.99]
MKKLLISILLLLSLVSLPSPAFAGDAAKGAKVFNANCASCHMGGNNVVAANKTLKKDDLEKYGKNSLEAIVAQVTKGNGAMPAFAGRLTPDEIENVATYVLSKAESGWK